MSHGNAIIDPLVRELMESAATGEAAKLFLNSEFGRGITARAVEEVEEAYADFVEADPNDAKLIAYIQRRIKVPIRAITWLTEAVDAGDYAMRQLHEAS